MRVFVTGASGHIGSAVVPELLGAGHQVVGLARSDASADKVAALGAEVRRGDLDDLDGLREAAALADGVLHLAYKHEAMLRGDLVTGAVADLRAVEAMGEALTGSDKPLVIMGGTLLLTFAGITGRPGTEEDVLASAPRADSENAVIALAGRGVRSAAVRLSPVVHSAYDRGGFIPTLISIAAGKGFSAYVGEGANHWPAVHTLDAARLCRLALEKAPAGSRLHAAADEGIPFRRIAESIGRHLDVPVKSVTAEEAADHFGFLGALVTLDNPVSTARTREVLGWQPVHPGLLADLDEGHYFAGRTA
ncbi:MULTISPECIES: SDR family oxidoreductase [Streptomycetaceae]|uniref:NAD-dependent epimerase/dehydratase n=1 Tax=Streptantibioticus cattleyicolor (strain ATCC 35852 / DSM 46488 / JCM 4925 / NBRC 14057 / NRRL 8057) TaxID=1003195 RepID=F8JRN4_STREN|nr:MULTISPECIES: SDR family oxidoreductase [Streptomycetaceae]AEW97922.1 NAD-dependent epimerase/dehydratase [Streptantibioticus cattleyicolor NRRL 8057 = DSM 46488]MYS62327.1 NAD-dependent epimerase/dehydratase family protein [Streptomyces sp. SID5468]CCB78238.1 conserved protein of unknown function [Streptantibioticus cattleyicolor NRRL 8057 = DSM 46488]